MKVSAQTLPVAVQFVFVSGLIVTGYFGYAYGNETTGEIELELDNNHVVDGLRTITDHLTLRNKTETEIVLKIPYLHLFLELLQFNKKEYNESIPFDKNQCNTDLTSLGESLSNKWAIPLIDSYGKPASGIAEGATFWPGNYGQCTSFQSPKTKLFPSGFKGRYCLLMLSPVNSSLAIQTGICIPNTCDSSQLNNDYSQLKKLLNILPTTKNYTNDFPNVYINCLPENVPLNSASIGCVVLLALVFTITIIGTLYDVFQRYYEAKKFIPASVTNIEMSPSDDLVYSNNQQMENHKEVLVQVIGSNRKKWVDVLLCFSVLKNGQSILDTSERAGQLNCLNGIRFISMTWVILGHTYVFGMGSFSNVLGMLKNFNTWHFQAIANAPLSVDTFFFLSGFLLTYLFLKDRSLFTIKKLGSLYLHRYIRLTPVYMVVLFFFATLFNFIGDGPFWAYSLQQSNPCDRNWWKNLLYINNFSSSSDICVSWSWYLANDMQFFIISPLFLVLLRSPKSARRYTGLGIIVALLLGSWITTGIMTSVNKLGIMFQGLGDDKDFAKVEEAGNTEFNLIYDKPYTRIGPYLIGCLLGFCFIELKGVTKFLSCRWVIIGWCSAIALALTDVYGLYNTHPGLTTSGFYNALGRSAWSIALSWVIFACLTGHGGFIDTFLSWKFFFPLSRLTYCAYLTHPLILTYYYQTLRSSFYLSSTVVAVHYLGFTILTYGVALITSLTFEAPIIKLEKLFWQ